MRLQKILGGLTPAEKSALKVLDESGHFGLMYDTKIEDGFLPDGQRPRTFTKSGRYQLVLMFDPGKAHSATGLFAEPESAPEPQQEDAKSEPEKIAPEPGPPEMKHTRPVPWVEEPFVEPPAPVVEEAEVEVFEVVEAETADEPEPEVEPEHKTARSHHKTVKKKKHK